MLFKQKHSNFIYIEGAIYLQRVIFFTLVYQATKTRNFNLRIMIESVN